MIVTAILTFVAAVLGFLLMPFTAMTSLPAEWAGFTYFLHGFAVLKAIPFLGIVLQLAALVVLALGSWQVVYWLNWTFNKIRGSG